MILPHYNVNRLKEYILTVKSQACVPCVLCYALSSRANELQMISMKRWHSAQLVRWSADTRVQFYDGPISVRRVLFPIKFQDQLSMYLNCE